MTLFFSFCLTVKGTAHPGSTVCIFTAQLNASWGLADVLNSRNPSWVSQRERLSTKVPFKASRNPHCWTKSLTEENHNTPGLICVFGRRCDLFKQWRWQHAFRQNICWSLPTRSRIPVVPHAQVLGGHCGFPLGRNSSPLWNLRLVMWTVKCHQRPVSNKRVKF